MNIKDITEETGWDLVEILKKVNSLPHVTEEVTLESLQSMNKEEFVNFLLGKKGDDLYE